MSLALKRLHDLKKSSLAPFVDKWNLEIEFYQALYQGPYEELMGFFERLERKLAAMRREIVANARLHQLHPDFTSRLIYHALPLFSWQSLCPVCFGLDDDDVLYELEESGKLNNMLSCVRLTIT